MKRQQMTEQEAETAGRMILVVHFTPIENPLIFVTDDDERTIAVYRVDEIDLEERIQAWAGRNPLFAHVPQHAISLLQDDPLGGKNTEYVVPERFAESFFSREGL